MIAEMLAPPSRLTGAHFAELARSVRQRAPEGDLKADSVAAALESVAHRRASSSWLRHGRTLLSLLAQMLAPRPAPRAMRQVRASATSVSVKAPSASKKVPRAASQQQIAKALADTRRGLGVQPDLCETLVKAGWVQWRHRETGEIVDECHPLSLLKLMPAGKLYLQLAAEHAMREECHA